jgi:hypothetical protein
MDVVLGVAVTGPVARLALIGSGAAGRDVIDQSVIDLADRPIETLTETVVGTNRLLADESHRLVATRLCWTDHPKADQLRRALEDSGVHDVAVLSESQAASALMRVAGRPGAVLVVDDETATLSMIGAAAVDEHSSPTLLAAGPVAGAEATATFDTLMARLGDRPDAPQDLYLVGASTDLARVADQLRDASTVRVEIADDPTFALARGAALAVAPLASAPDATMAQSAFSAGDATAMAPAARPTGDETTIVPAAAFADPNADDQLAYSMAGDDELLPVDMDDEYDDDYDDVVDADAQTGPVRLSTRSLLISNAVIAFAVIGFASLAVAVVVAVRPAAAQEPVVGHQNAAPGKFMPLLPTQQQAPVPAPPPDQPNAGYQGGTIPDSNGYIPQQGPSLGGGGPAPVAPAPVAPAPGIPGLMPNPNMPIPIPIIIPPHPGWQPNQPPYPPPYRPPYPPPYQPPTPPYTPPTTTYEPPTTTHEPPTTTYEPPTTTYEPPTTTHEPPTTTYTPPTTATTQPPTSAKPPATSTQPSVAPSAKPTTQAPEPTTQAPVPTHTQTQQPVTPKPATPQEPHGGGGGGGGSGGGGGGGSGGGAGGGGGGHHGF